MKSFEFPLHFHIKLKHSFQNHEESCRKFIFEAFDIILHLLHVQTKEMTEGAKSSGFFIKTHANSIGKLFFLVIFFFPRN